MDNITITQEIILKAKLPKDICVREFTEKDFPSVQTIYRNEGWMTFINRADDGLEAWKNSNIALVAVEGDSIIGFVRALTDGKITTYIAEIVVDKHYRGKGIGKALIDICHHFYPNTRLDLLSSEEADRFYEKDNFRGIPGFRKSYY
jgi:ribosomal protein S18 acetylase RimI-like enzyme